MQAGVLTVLDSNPERLVFAIHVKISRKSMMVVHVRDSSCEVEGGKQGICERPAACLPVCWHLDLKDILDHRAQPDARH